MLGSRRQRDSSDAQAVPVAEAPPPKADAAATPSAPEAVAAPQETPGTSADSVQPSPVHERRVRELRQLRGFNLGAALYGWLVSVGIDVLLASLLAAAGAAISLQQNSGSLSQNGTALTIAGASSLLVVLILGYYAGGYVAGRLSRFGGAVQGFGVWLIGLVVTIALAIAGYVAGAQYNVLGQLHLPSLPTQGQSLVTGGIIALVLIAAVTLIAAILGGVVGHHYHIRVDRALSATRADA